MSLLVVSSCEFVEFAATNSTDPNEPGTVVQFSFGQFRYDANNTGCRSMNDDYIEVDWTIRSGRVSTFVSLICACAACLIILVEFLCCRFRFSRCLMITLFSIAILGMALGFLMFASDIWYVVLFFGSSRFYSCALVLCPTHSLFLCRTTARQRINRVDGIRARQE